MLHAPRVQELTSPEDGFLPLLLLLLRRLLLLLGRSFRFIPFTTFTRSPSAQLFLLFLFLFLFLWSFPLVFSFLVTLPFLFSFSSSPSPPPASVRVLFAFPSPFFRSPYDPRPMLCPLLSRFTLLLRQFRIGGIKFAQHRTVRVPRSLPLFHIDSEYTPRRSFSPLRVLESLYVPLYWCI